MRRIKLSEVERKVGFKKTKIYRMIEENEFPKQLKDGSSSFWIESEIDTWIKQRHNLEIS